ncbi:IS200/IS605 family transposase [Geitlerinema sp. PCC 7407]|uniref:IS200/IS605 family transposase n=1 Tax=Geitlerinema sp. PCC 7407 TaxID=1173025 RepID=UPI00029FCA49|nr:IS200/IS605 family transposase [Geitlerinema sp. PCC 7407]AFY67449.1 transposase IS200-family protein [Geitlerinema sp. PCC 7407]
MQPSRRKGSHSVFSIYLHLVFVTKYRQKVIDDSMLQTMTEVFQRVCVANKSKVIEVNGEPDHVHLLLDLHPDNNISQLVASLKGASSRIVRKQHSERLASSYTKPVFWSSSYYVSSAGGAPLERIKQYIDEQPGVN